MRNIMKVLALGAFLALSAPAYSQDAIRIQVAPPAAQVETIPRSPQRGAIWTPGYYQFDPSSQSYVWQAGSWQVPPSRKMQWVAAHYTTHDDGSYEFTAGHWATRHQAHEERDAELKRER